MKAAALAESRALWNRNGINLASDEVLAQILDRGSMSDWRSVYASARRDPSLRERIKRVVLTVPVPLPHFWLAALASLGEVVDLDAELLHYFHDSSV